MKTRGAKQGRLTACALPGAPSARVTAVDSPQPMRLQHETSERKHLEGLGQHVRDVLQAGGLPRKLDMPHHRRQLVALLKGALAHLTLQANTED